MRMLLSGCPWIYLGWCQFPVFFCFVLGVEVTEVGFVVLVSFLYVRRDRQYLYAFVIARI